MAASYQGFLSIRTAFEGSKSERPQPFLDVGNGLVPVFLKGDNPFGNAGLAPYLNKRVTCTGAWHRQTFVVSEIAEVEEMVEATELAETEIEVTVVEETQEIQPDADIVSTTDSSEQSFEETVLDEDSSFEE